MDTAEITLLRLVAQRIAGPKLGSAAEVVGWLTAIQAQDLPGALTSVALRTAAGTRDAVEAALASGEVVRTWPMRGTLHLVLAEDLPWLVDLLAGRAVAGAASRRANLGLDAETLARAGRLAVAALAGGRHLSRHELLAVWQAGGIEMSNPRGYHLLGHLAQTGVVCLGPMRGKDQLVVLVDEWIPRPRRLAREAALGELADRFFRSHGPATLKDLIRWGNLPAADARAGLALARPRLARLVVDEREYFLDPGTPDLLAACRREAQGAFLLPGFDELVLGYADRSATVPLRFADRVVPGGNGVFRPTVVDRGQIVGTWRYAGRGARRTIDATGFETLPDRVTQRLPKLAAALL
jgi:hypothetical protein